ncbi:MAG TPA: type II secretion system protein GspM, partial [Burkholderiaceae bacterium]|nr:type II secretion system protein GspM [Burkholderiaceae bacterium]
MSASSRRLALPPRLAAWQAPLRARWQAMAPRERRLVLVCGIVLLLGLLWLVALQPALRT